MGGEKRIEKTLPRLYDADEGAFRRSLSALLGPQLLEGNRVEILLNGDRIFPPMLHAIAAARNTITFETFIYWSGEVGEAFVAALCERARAGVSVHVLLDWVGSVKMDDSMLDRLEKSGVEINRFHKPHWTHWGRMNNRTHRKLLVVDGAVGFTGGVGIADQWQGDARSPEEWRDSHFRVEGPVVAQMQAVFLDNWMRATGHVLHGESYFPVLRPMGDQAAQMFSSSPSGGSESMHLMFLLALTAARQHIDLSASYFVPDSLTIHTLTAAAARGVVVRVLLPSGHIDSIFVRKASRASWGPLLRAGVQIAEYQPTMFHNKGLVVDGRFVSVGSTNFDNRSFLLNDEANLNVLDTSFAARMHRVFETDWAQGERITLAMWRSRPWQEKLLEQGARLLRSQL
ncbi:phospholipase D-like domain-containing protein [Hydrogenophaga crassostreae]|nr:phospholipase D-like domain-containing protein [Hydrogenophaga crassostreae]